MINFFRNTRMQLANDNQFIKYSRYAVGEIILVVIGIVIAIQINNWNEERKQTKEELSILNNLSENLISASVQSKNHINEEDRLISDLLSALNKDMVRINDSVFKNLLWDFESDIPVMNSYADLKSTGRTALIKNKQIRENFTNLEISINNLENLVKDRLTVQQIRIDNIAHTQINFVRLMKKEYPSINLEQENLNDYTVILDQPDIRNLIAIKLELTDGVLKYRKALLNQINELDKLLKNEIESLKH